MTRPVDEARRNRLLERAADYLMENGLADLSLRPLAAAIGSSPRVLLYFYGSKEQLVAEALRRARARQRSLFEAMRGDVPSSPGEYCRAIWRAMSAPKMLPVFKLFFEVYALALRDPKRFPGFLERAVSDWIAYIEDPLVQAGFPPSESKAWATIVIATYRGFLLDLCATGDRARVDRAVEMWVRSLQVFEFSEE